MELVRGTSCSGRDVEDQFEQQAQVLTAGVSLPALCILNLVVYVTVKARGKLGIPTSSIIMLLLPTAVGMYSCRHERALNMCPEERVLLKL